VPRCLPEIILQPHCERQGESLFLLDRLRDDRCVCDQLEKMKTFSGNRIDRLNRSLAYPTDSVILTEPTAVEIIALSLREVHFRAIQHRVSAVSTGRLNFNQN